MAVWREEDHPRDDAGRFTFKGMASAVSIRRTLADLGRADESALLDVFLRITARARRGKRDEAQLAALDAELVRRSAPGKPEGTPEQRRVDELVAAGESWESAYAEAYGESRRRRGGEEGRRRGETSEQARRRQYTEQTYMTLLEAEQVTRGHMLTKEGVAKGVAVASLFSGPRARAERYASEELRRYWAEHPRRTYAEWRAELVGDTTGARQARRARVQAGNGKDYG